MNKKEQCSIIKEHIDTIEKNYPPENYTMLREALDYCLVMLKEKEKKIMDNGIEQYE